MLAVTRKLLVVVVLGVLLGSSGCCCCCNSGCCRPWARRTVPDGYTGGGSYWKDCGCSCERYYGDWKSNPPTCDPCDCYGNYAGDNNPVPGYQLPPRHSAGYGASGVDYAPPRTTAPTLAPPEEMPGGERTTSYEAPIAPKKKHCSTCGT